MSHTLIVGRTESGKTTKAVQLARAYQEAKVKVCVLDPWKDDRWRADFITDDPLEFLHLAKYRSSGCALFIDEAGKYCAQYDNQMFWLATEARHRHHRSHFISQRAQMISPNVRTNCGRLCLFQCAASDAKILADEFNEPRLRDANALDQFQYMEIYGFNKFRVARVDVNKS